MDLAMGQKPIPPVNIPIQPLKIIGSKMGGAPNTPNMGSQNGFDPHSYGCGSKSNHQDKYGPVLVHASIYQVCIRCIWFQGAKWISRPSASKSEPRAQEPRPRGVPAVASLAEGPGAVAGDARRANRALRAGPKAGNPFWCLPQSETGGHCFPWEQVPCGNGLL